MKAKAYAKEFINALKDHDVCKKLKWDFEVYSNDQVEAIAQIPTVAGKRNVVVVFIDGAVFPVIVLSRGVNRENLSDETWLDVFEKMNEVNWISGNLLVAFCTQGEDGFDFYLRGTKMFTDQDKITTMSAQEWNIELAINVSFVADFIGAVNNDEIRGILQDLMDTFD